MVFTTVVNFLRTRGPDEFWRKRRMFKLAAHFYGRRRNCYGIAIRGVHRALQHATKGREIKKLDMIELWETRISAAAGQHGLSQWELSDGLHKSNIQLNRKVLSELAVWEPATFEALAKIAEDSRKNDRGSSIFENFLQFELEKQTLLKNEDHNVPASTAPRLHVQETLADAGKQRVRSTPAEAVLAAQGIKVTNAHEYLENWRKKDFTPFKLELPNIFEIPVPTDETHPDYKERGIYLFGDSNVPVYGVPQAQSLLKTVVIEGLPDRVKKQFESVKLPSDLERSMQQSVLVSHLLDAEQQKTAKIKNPLKPMFVFPRNFGITEARKNLLLSTRLINHCERYHGHTIAADRKIVNDAFFVTPFSREGSNVQLEVSAETFMTSKKPISAFEVDSSIKDQEIPDIFPLKNTVSIPNVHFYDERSDYPISSTNEYPHPHTIMLHYSHLDVSNLFDAPVTDDQIESRAMLKGFAVAASRAHKLYGQNVKDLKRPITVQVVQLESQRVQFGIFQLNTLDLDGTSGLKNFWFRNPITNLYDDCFYNDGRPALTAYNFDVLRLMSVFYGN